MGEASSAATALAPSLADCRAASWSWSARETVQPPAGWWLLSLAALRSAHCLYLRSARRAPPGTSPHNRGPWVESFPLDSRHQRSAPVAVASRRRRGPVTVGATTNCKSVHL
ncbi:hypothetical protein GUJ93_ZPchr0458g22617 [Zizania palustris]|uniref:Uncharacterized protein n=1 Tax=Zizania palustris TaxID=103762 RepID=A0A8J5R062_ZIZPA|nr:hypothetical protein GUJ93_ZPchr0458g22617 [Zizania palustris]